MTDDTDEARGTASAARRPVLKGLLGVGALAAGGGVAWRALTEDDADPFGDVPSLGLSSDGDDMSSVEVEVDDRLARKVGPRQWRSSEIHTSSYSMVAFLWPSSVSHPPQLRVRTRRDGSWSGWRDVRPLHDLPDRGTGEGRGRAGSDPIWVGMADGIQIEVSGSRPQRLRMLLLYPHPRLSDRDADQRTAISPKMRGDVAELLRPNIRTRKQWGADESWKLGPPRYNKVTKQVHVHHSDNANDYSADDVPRLLRGIYRYHTHSLGWNDIAYNFLIDRFGRIWEGRAGGVARAVRGAHTLGFNATSTGVCVIGNFEVAKPSAKVIDSIASVAAWKLWRAQGRPLGKVRVESEGSDKFRSGARPTLPVIDGHRDTNDTACPGRHIYVQLPAIRRLTRRKIGHARAKADPVKVEKAGSLAGAAIVGKRLVARPGEFDPAQPKITYRWKRDGVAIPGATGASYQVTPADFRSSLSVDVGAVATLRGRVWQTLEPDGTVRAQAQVKATTRGLARGAKVSVKVSAPEGISKVPTGEVTIHVRGKSRTVRLDAKGAATVVFRDLEPGEAKVSVHYSGGGGFRRAWRHPTVKIRRR